MEQIYLIIGILLLVLMAYDFFFTTLSGSGSGFLTRWTLGIAAKMLRLGFSIFGRKFFGLSGMLVNLSVLALWIIMAWLGVFFIYSSDPAAIIDNYGVPAGTFDRLYFTGYTLSTLGNGDLRPTTHIFKLITSICSFFGFVFFTTSITYLLSVSNSVIHKRSMALFIWTMGSTPEEVANTLETSLEVHNYNKLSQLEGMLHKYTVINHAYPVLHYYHNTDVHNSLALNLATLDEGLNILQTRQHSTAANSYLAPLRKALDNFLRFLEKNEKSGSRQEEVQPPHIPRPVKPVYPGELDLEHRRRLLGILLHNEGFGWKDVYSP